MDWAQQNGSGFRCPFVNCEMTHDCFPDQKSLGLHVNLWHTSNRIPGPTTSLKQSRNSSIPGAPQYISNRQNGNNSQLNPIYIPDSTTPTTPTDLNALYSPLPQGYVQLAQGSASMPMPPPPPPPQPKVSQQSPISPADLNRQCPEERQGLEIEPSTNWPPNTESHLKRLMIKYRLSAYPMTDPNSETKVRMIFADFYNEAVFPGWKPKGDDKLLWRLFTSNLDSVRADMIKNREVCKTPEGYILYSATHTTELLMSPPVEIAVLPAPTTTAAELARRVDKSQPHAPTSEIPTVDTYRTALEIWKSFDAATQARMFRDQVLHARDTRNLVEEWDKYCVEETEKRERERQRHEQEKLEKAKEKTDMEEAVRVERARIEAASKEEARIEKSAAFVKWSLTLRDQKIADDPSMAEVENASHNDRCEIHRYMGLRQVEPDFEKLDKAEQDEQLQKVKQWVINRRKKQGIDSESVLKRLAVTPPLTPVAESRCFPGKNLGSKISDTVTVTESNQESTSSKQELGSKVVNEMAEMLEPKKETPEPKRILESKPVNLKAAIAARMLEMKAKRELEGGSKKDWKKRKVEE